MTEKDCTWVTTSEDDNGVRLVCNYCGREKLITVRSGVYIRQKSREFIEVHAICDPNFRS